MYQPKYCNSGRVVFFLSPQVQKPPRIMHQCLDLVIESREFVIVCLIFL